LKLNGEGSGRGGSTIPEIILGGPKKRKKNRKAQCRESKKIKRNGGKERKSASGRPTRGEKEKNCILVKRGRAVHRNPRRKGGGGEKRVREIPQT